MLMDNHKLIGFKLEFIIYSILTQMSKELVRYNCFNILQLISRDSIIELTKLSSIILTVQMKNDNIGIQDLIDPSFIERISFRKYLLIRVLRSNSDFSIKFNQNIIIKNTGLYTFRSCIGVQQLGKFTHAVTYRYFEDQWSVHNEVQSMQRTKEKIIKDVQTYGYLYFYEKS